MRLFLYIVLYFWIGVAIASLYNLMTGCSAPPNMTESEKNVMFGNIVFWPIVTMVWFIKSSIRYIKWLISNGKEN